MIYGDEIKRINDTYDGYITNINNKYDALKAEIESKEITEEYTIEIQRQELQENENKRNTELADNEAERQEALKNYDQEYVNKVNDIINSKGGVDFGLIMDRIEDVDFTAPEPLDVDITTMESVMASLPATVNNTKYIFLTFDNKYLALEKMSEEEHAKYLTVYEGIEARYDELEQAINSKYDSLIDELMNSGDETITEQIEQLEQERTAELEANEASKYAEIEPVNDEYITIMLSIAKKLTALKSDKETGFNGDVHIMGKLHVDTDINIEGKINNISPDDIVTRDILSAVEANKADKEHTHNINDIEGYFPGGYDDTEIRDKQENLTSMLDNVSIQVSGIQPQIDNKADKDHQHEFQEIIGSNAIFELIDSKAYKDHKHVLTDISDYHEPPVYDDTEIRSIINEKSDKEHTHNINDIQGYEPYNDSELRTMIATVEDGKADKEHTHDVSDILGNNFKVKAYQEEVSGFIIW